MQLLTPDQIANKEFEHTFRNRSWLGLVLVVLIMLGVTLYIAIPKAEPTNPLLIAFPAAITLFFAVFALLRLRVALKPNNWLLRVAPEGLYVNLRSFLNYHLPATDPTALFIPKDEVAAIGKTTEARKLPTHRGRDDRIYSAIDIYLTHDDTGAVREALRRERRRLPERAGWFSRPKQHDYPVRVLDPPGIRLIWDWIKPPEATALEILSERYPVAPDRETALAQWDDMSAEEREALIAELWEQGFEHEAFTLARLHKNAGRRAARQYLASLIDDA